MTTPLPAALLLLHDITIDADVTCSSVVCAFIVVLISCLVFCNLVMALYMLQYYAKYYSILSGTTADISRKKSIVVNNQTCEDQ
jgi:hypothetical protein